MGQASALIGWIYKLQVSDGADDAGEIARRLLDELEGALVDRGARRLATLVGAPRARRHTPPSSVSTSTA